MDTLKKLCLERRVIQFTVVDSVLLALLSSKATMNNYNGSDFTDSIANVIVLGVKGYLRK
ncbi:hypothetical protein V7S43_004454 [Phytophthora oleae]|uniref:Uncharacterized protein n=1 Tax=Phytophthora oleae TaxID=2107226 RepID=A0ABD3FV78_9STRA